MLRLTIGLAVLLQTFIAKPESIKVAQKDYNDTLYATSGSNSGDPEPPILPPMWLPRPGDGTKKS